MITVPESRLIVQAGDPLRLICPVEADPSLLIEWIKDGEKVNGAWEPRVRITDDFVLKIKEALVEDRGVYECKATNGFGSGHAKIIVRVSSKPLFTSTAIFSMLFTWLQVEMRLSTRSFA